MGVLHNRCSNKVVLKVYYVFLLATLLYISFSPVQDTNRQRNPYPSSTVSRKSCFFYTLTV